MRLVLRALAILAGFIFCVAFHYLWKAFGLRRIWPQVFLGYAGYCCGARVRIEGVPVQGHVLVAANHASWIDILVLGGATMIDFVARSDVKAWPVIGWAAGLNDSIFINRDVRATVRDQADILRDALKGGRTVGLFPEGTTDGGRALLPFRASLFASLYPPLPGVKVQPVVIDYGTHFEDVSWAGDEEYAPNAKRILSHPGSFPIIIRFLEPIDPAEFGDRKALAARSQAAVAAALAASTEAQ
jgi:1-acyl-sn-glycerol-3-phosphate acyltransferase